MMDMIDTFVTELLLISNAAMLAAALLAISRFRNQARHFEKLWESSAAVPPEDRQPRQPEQPAPPQSNPQLEEKVAELQSVVTMLASKSQAIPKSADNKLPIENAVRMARHGASVDDLIRGCGLNQGEAQLMRKMYGQPRAAADCR